MYLLASPTTRGGVDFNQLVYIVYNIGINTWFGFLQCGFIHGYGACVCVCVFTRMCVSVRACVCAQDVLTCRCRAWPRSWGGNRTTPPASRRRSHTSCPRSWTSRRRPSRCVHTGYFKIFVNIFKHFVFFFSTSRG